MTKEKEECRIWIDNLFRLYFFVVFVYYFRLIKYGYFFTMKFICFFYYLCKSKTTHFNFLIIVFLRNFCIISFIFINYLFYCCLLDNQNVSFLWVFSSLIILFQFIHFKQIYSQYDCWFAYLVLKPAFMFKHSANVLNYKFKLRVNWFKMFKIKESESGSGVGEMGSSFVMIRKILRIFQMTYRWRFIWLDTAKVK